MRSIFRYPGGKTKRQIQDCIISHKPPVVREYRECFVGGGGIFFGLESQIENVWLNDKHEGLMAVYFALKHRPDQFIKACREIAPACETDGMTEIGKRGGQPKNKRLSAKFDELKLNEDCDQALRYFFVNRTVHGSGRVNYDIPSRLYFSNPDGWNITTTDLLECAAELLKNAKLTKGDYAAVMDAPGEDVWIYADPPYVVNGNLTRTSQLYQHSFDAADHRRFAEVVRRCKHNVCVSYDADDDGFVRSLFPEPQFRFVECSWKYSGTSEEVKREGKELLILNYDPPEGRIVIGNTEVIDGFVAGEREQLRQLEQVIATGIKRQAKSFVDIGKALAAIRDSGQPSRRLYRATHAKFEDYCRDRWNINASRASQYITGASRHEAVKTLTTVSVLPNNERQVRELARLESDEQAAEVWQKVVDSVSGPKAITAAVIRKHVNEAIGYEPPAPADKVEVARKALLKLSAEQLSLLLAEFLKQAEAA